MPSQDLLDSLGLTLNDYSFMMSLSGFICGCILVSTILIFTKG